MKAFVLREVKSPLVAEQRPDLRPGPQQVVVRLHAAAVNRRDYWITQGLYPGIEPPIVLGSDGVGVVTQTGAGVGNYWTGREVIINPGFGWGDDPRCQAENFRILGLPDDGTFATEVLAPVSQLHLRPEHLTLEEAAALPLAGVTAFRATFVQGGLQPGETVLISGAGGGVATFALQYAVAAGATAWVTSSSAEKIRRAVELGAAGGVNYRDDGWEQRLAACCAPDLIIDSAGGPGYAALLNAAGPGARIVNYGATAGPPPKLDLFKVFWKQLRIQGTTMGSPADFAAMLRFVEQHRIRPLIDRVLPLEQVNDALQLMERSPQFGKLVLDCRDDAPVNR
ncbi:MAG: zinc-binding dehydrogenase [Planctomycetales bacterium]|nr:zinc-binding dehydrogenase [Planctomycetales bacterium]